MIKRNADLTVGEVARKAALRPSAIRYYERAGLLPAPMRVNGWRRYDETVLLRLAIIDVAQRAGFTLAEVRTLLQGFSPRTSPSSRWHRLARQKLPEVEALIVRAGIMKRLLEEGLNCGCVRLKDCALLVPATGPADGNGPRSSSTVRDSHGRLPRGAASRALRNVPGIRN